jgi:hypothetical protein
MLDVFDLTAGRPAGDILSRTVRVRLGGSEYELPVRSIKANRDWRAALNAGTASLVSGLADSGDDFGAIYAALASQMDTLIDLLLSYDTSSILPTKDEIEAIEPDCSLDIVAAVREVWRAANPLVVTSLTAMETPASASSEPTSSPPTSTAGRRRKSKTN